MAAKQEDEDKPAREASLLLKLGAAQLQVFHANPHAVYH